MADKKPGKEIVLPAPDIQVLKVEVEGTSSLICHRFSTKSLKEIEDKQQHKPTKGKAARNPEQEFKDALYPLSGKNGSYGFPTSAFKKAMVAAAYRVLDVKMTIMRAAFFVVGDLVELTGRAPTMRTDFVRVKGNAHVRYRGDFEDWGAMLTIQYNARVISAAQILNLLANAGFSIGVGDWRPEKDGTHGMFRIKEPSR
jgi:hypothetical protein